ncbi:HNH endonuclease signature motif containing protein [Microbacterium galbinum]|uniref:HNH endonuclease signature motif containing protein n=1 Tax=Microbacterium galbinum TaxID=2851646 RepID=UPI001FFC7F03|nr:HNH endonuclease signature motif containing protein [Microbacterium galbinum]MCK2029204.1 HNH endonuclease [Microbacterium galbinum]
MNSTTEVVDRVAADLAAVLRADALAGLSDAEKMQVLRAAGELARRVDAVIVETVGSVDQRPAESGELAFCGRFGCRTMNELVQRVLRTDAAGAARVVKAGKIVRRELDFSSGAMLPARWPALREALLDGAVGVAGLLAATGPVEQAGPRIGAADRLRADAELAEYARGLIAVDGAGTSDADGNADAERRLEAGPPATPEDLKLLSRVIVTYLDPDGAEPAEERAMRARGIVLGRVKDGVIPIRGSLLPETAGQLRRIWDAYLNPKVDGPPIPEAPQATTETVSGVRFGPATDEARLDTDEHALNGETHGPLDDTLHPLDDRVFPYDDSLRPLDGAVFPSDGVLPSGDPGGMLDDRSRAQKQHDALAAALGIAARHSDMPSLGGAAPTLVVSVTAEDYASGRGWAHVDGIDTPVSLATARHTACGGSIQRVTSDPAGRIIGINTTDRVFTAHQRRAITLRDRECLIPGCHVPAAWCEIHHVTEHSRGGPTSTDNGVTLCWHHHRTLDTSGWEIRMHNGTPHVRGPAWWDPHQHWRAPRPRTHAAAMATATATATATARHRTRTPIRA